jgi:hypothetical protein
MSQELTVLVYALALFVAAFATILTVTMALRP